MSRYRRAKIAGGTFFFTLTLADRRDDLLVRHVARLRKIYRFVEEQRPFETIAICILPDHLHAIWALPDDDADFSTRWGVIKSGFVGRVGIEASGGYERGVVKHLQAWGFIVLVLQPIQVRAFARMHLRRAKNDVLDAVLIAACAAAIEGPRIEPDARLAELADHLTFVEQIEEDIARLKTRLEHVHDRRMRRIVVADIARLKARRTAELLRIVGQLRSHADLARRLDLVLSVPGIGERTALALIIRMPELGRISREQAAALVGLAPSDDDSGKHKGHRHIAGGRGRLRRSLYAAALTASFRWNKALIELYARLIARGKAHNAALVACARKLLIYANTVVARGTPWLETLAVS